MHVGDGHFVMGEIGLLDADGYLYLTDRASDLVVSGGVVEKHVASIFGKLGLPPSEPDNRRVLAVLRYLGS